MLASKNQENKFNYPICNKSGCEGCLKIKINEYNFTIDFECEKNRKHRKGGLLFDTFEKFYLKEKEHLKCSKCKYSLDDNDIFKCKKCEKSYCLKCFRNDEHIEKDINNLSLNSNKCQICQKELIKYCLDCGKKICLYCLKNDSQNSPHRVHKTEYILDSMPTNKQIDELNKKISDKIKNINEILDLIDKWHSTFLQKLNRLKKNLKNEIRFIEKLFKNFNPNFANYFYYKNFNNFNEDLGITENKFLKKFKNSLEFEEQSKNIYEVLFYNKSNTDEKIGVLKYDAYLQNGLVSYLDEEKFLIHYDNSNYFDINYYSKETNQLCYYIDTKTEIDEKIFSVSFSKIKNKIYACLGGQKVVKIYDYIKNPKTKIKMCNEDIKDTNNLRGHFNKCIYLTNDNVATSDDEKISIWHENINQISNFYSNTTNIELNTDICDLLLINDHFFCSAQNSKKSIIFYDVNNFTKEKTIQKINSVNSFNCLFLIKKFIIANCCDGIAVFSSKSKELVQFIQNLSENQDKRICVGNDSIYILDKSFHLLVTKMQIYDGVFVVTEQYKILYKEIEKDDENSLNKLISLYNLNKLGILYSNNAIVVFGKSIYSLKENVPKEN